MTQKYFGCSIAELLPRINNDVLIPSIQRPYVWETEQIVKLFDSLMRGYPINAFLLWSLEPEHIGDWDIFRFVRDFKQGDVHNDLASVDDGKPLVLVLDGQQRLTSLLIGLTGSYTVRNGLRGRGAAWTRKVLMLNLAQSPEPDVDDDDGFTVRELYYGFKFHSVDRLPKNDRSAVWFKVANIVSISDEAQLAATIDHLLVLNPDLPEEAQSQLRANLKRLWSVVHEEVNIAYYLEREQSYDKVLDIFVRANDGGTKLSRSDLLMSMVTLRWDQFNARAETEAITYAMRKALDHEAAFDRDYLLRSGLFFNDLDFGFQLRNFTPRNIAMIEARWGRVKKALQLSTDLFRQFAITGSALIGLNAVMLIACYIFKRNQALPEDQWTVSATDFSRIRRWVSGMFFFGILGGQANVTMEFYRRIINECLTSNPGFPIEELSERMSLRARNMRFDDESVAKFCAMETRHRLGEVCLRMLYDRDDWFVKDWQVVQIIPSNRLLDDRLRVQGVPQEEIPAFQSWAHRLANHMILNDAEAQQYYSSDLEDWMRTRSPEFLRLHHLPDDPALYEEFNFLSFIQARKKLLHRHLQSVLSVEKPFAPFGLPLNSEVSTVL